jgi:hypothetical protein
MMAYLWQMCLRSKRFKDIKDSQNKVSKDLEMSKLFKTYDYCDKVEKAGISKIEASINNQRLVLVERHEGAIA